jgi:hypothetical protein
MKGRHDGTDERASSTEESKTATANLTGEEKEIDHLAWIV